MKKLTVLIFLVISGSLILQAQSYSGGSGTSGDPYQIANKTDLKYLSEHSGEWSKHFKQTANITFQSSDFESGGDFYNDGGGFIPIGYYNNEFTGTYDGDYHTIDGLYINRPSSEYNGFFGIAVSISISNLGLTNVNITGYNATGGFIGMSYSFIENCFSTGTVTGSHFMTRLGGFCGYLGEGTISNCYSSATVTGTNNDNVGGFAGRASDNITNCYSTGDVVGSGLTGGFVGFNDRQVTISDCYSTGNVSRASGSDDTRIGAFCGINGYSLYGLGTILRCYSTGSVTYINATNPTNKGFSGLDEGTFNDNFFDSDVSNQSSGNGATAKTTSQMQTQSTFTNWDFTNVWQIIGGDGANYPTLINNPEPTTEAPTTQASNIVYSNVYATQMDLSWTNGDGTKRVVFAKAASSGTTSPVDGTTYTANATFGSGTQIGSTGWYCIYNGSGSSVSVTSLTAGTDYIFQVFEYNGRSESELYLTNTATNNPKVRSTNTTPAPNYALDFDGTNDYVSVPANASLNMGGSSFTLEMWVKSSSTHSSWILPLEYGNWTTGTYQFASANSNTMKVDFYGSSSANGASYTTDWTDGKWHHFAGVFDNTNNLLILYYDGVNVSQVTETNAPASNTVPLYIGSRGGSSLFYTGEMDEVRIWDVARTQTQIQDNMCKKLAGNESGLVAYYQMTNGSGTTLSDNSSNSNNGTLQNMDNANWVSSGAAIGDVSIADYNSPTSVNLASTDGDDVTVGSPTGSPDGVQIYLVDGAPNVITPPGNMTELYTDHYFGVFIAGGTSPTYTLTYNYEGYPGITDENDLDLAYRANNAAASWTEGNAALNTTANTLILTGQTGTEYILGTETISVPTTQATNLVFSQVYATQMNVSWTNGNGSKRAVFAKQANTGTASPADNTTYTANAAFSSGDQIGSTGWYCVYNGSGSSVSVTSLTASTDYIFQVFEYNGSSGSEVYLTTTAANNPKVQATSNAAVPTPNYALDFDGTNEYVSVPANASLNMGGSSFTLETWVKCSETFSTDVILIETGTWEVGTYQLTAPTSSSLKVLFNGRSSGNPTLSFNWADGNWHHIAGVFDNTNDKLILYVDGVNKLEVTENNAPGNATLPLYLGARGGSSLWYNGEMDEVRIWNVARTQTQIQENMCKKLAGSESGLVAYYQMTNGSGTTLSDNSSNSNNGTLQNMDNADWVTSGAAIGDVSIADYSSPSSVNLASTDGDDVTVGTITGSPDGVQIYRVDAAPNVTTPPGDMVILYPDHYFGVFIAGGTSPTYSLTYNYDGHPAVYGETGLDMAYRANNATASWTQGNATLDQGANTLTLAGQTGTEYILGDEAIVWDGSISTDWATAANWSSGVVPTTNANIVIPNLANDPVITNGTGASCNNLIVNSGASLTVNSGGSLITKGTVTNNGTITHQLTIPGNSNDWHLLSSPVAQQELSGNFTDANGYDFYLYNEPTDEWINQKNQSGGGGNAPYFDVVNGSINFTPARGYLVAYANPNTNAKAFVGTPNTGNQSIALTNSGSTGFAGANLVGNPYPSSIDWKAASGGWTRDMLVDDDDGAGIGYTMYIWNESASNYGTFISNGSSGTNSVTQYIPPMQGFFVMAASSGTLQMTNDVRVHNGATGWMKQQAAVSAVLKMKVAHPELGSDEAILEFSAQHSGGAPKWQSMVEQAPSLWIVEEDKDFAIRFTAPDRSAPLALHFLAGVQGAYTFSIDKAEMNFNQLVLEDLLLGTTHNLLEDNHYAFAADPSQSSHRFNLRFDLVGVDEKPESDNLMIWQQGELLQLTGVDEFTDLQLFDLHGKLLGYKKLYAASQQQIAAPKTAGVYVIRLFNAKQMITKKVIVY